MSWCPCGCHKAVELGIVMLPERNCAHCDGGLTWCPSQPLRSLIAVIRRRFKVV